MKILIKILLLSLMVLSTRTFADGLFRADFGYVMDETSSGGNDTKTSRQLIDLTGGYIWPQGWTVFGQYAMEKDDATNQQEGNRTSWGPGVGWISRNAVGPYITGTYYYSSRYVQGGSTLEGNGYQLDLGIKIDISKVFLVAGMSYETFEYNKNNGSSLSPSTKHSHIDPRIGLQLEF